MLGLQWRHQHSRTKRCDDAHVVRSALDHASGRECVAADIPGIHARAAATLYTPADTSHAADSNRGDAGDARPPAGRRASDRHRNSAIANWWNAGVRLVASSVRAPATARQRRSVSAAVRAGLLEQASRTANQPQPRVGRGSESAYAAASTYATGSGAADATSCAASDGIECAAVRGTTAEAGDDDAARCFTISRRRRRAATRESVSFEGSQPACE